MDKKYGVYICEGCGIGESLDVKALCGVPEEEGVPVKTHPFMCGKDGVDLLIDAFDRLLADIQDARLLLVGDGPERAGLEARPGRAAFLGECPPRQVAALLGRLHPRAALASWLVLLAALPLVPDTLAFVHA